MDLGFGQSRCWVVRTSLFQKAIRAISNLAPNCGYDRRLLRRSGDVVLVIDTSYRDSYSRADLRPWLCIGTLVDQKVCRTRVPRHNSGARRVVV
jgi:hypothetical protein